MFECDREPVRDFFVTRHGAAGEVRESRFCEIALGVTPERLLRLRGTRPGAYFFKKEKTRALAASLSSFGERDSTDAERRRLPRRSPTRGGWSSGTSFRASRARAVSLRKRETPERRLETPREDRGQSDRSANERVSQKRLLPTSLLPASIGPPRSDEARGDRSPKKKKKKKKKKIRRTPRRDVRRSRNTKARRAD